jgi:hypothetical protein
VFPPACLPRGLAASLAFAVALCSSSSRADDLAAAAQVLFEQGRDLLRAGKVAEACPKLAESQRLDPATGTLLALATCHEAEGKLASAWAEFSGVVTRAGREAQVERERWAKQRLQDLKPRLSTLELQIPSELAGLCGAEVRRDGVLLGKEAWNVPVPVDGGGYRITATAPGRAPWEAVVQVKQESDVVTLRLPELSSTPARASTSKADSASASRPANASVAAPPDGGDHAWSTSQRIGVVSLGAGLAAWGAAGALAYTAKAKSGESPNARTYGNWATGLAIGGGVAVASGLGLLLFAGSSKGRSATLARQLSVGAASNGVELGFQHEF